MKKPIELDVNHMGSLISALLLKRGQNEFTLPFEDYHKLDLGSYAVVTSAEWTGDKGYPDSITASVVHVDSLPAYLEELEKEFGGEDGH